MFLLSLMSSFLLIFLSKSECKSAPRHLLIEIDVIIYGNIIKKSSTDHKDKLLLEVEVLCKFKYDSTVPDHILISTYTGLESSSCKRSLKEGGNILFYLMTTSSPKKYNTVIAEGYSPFAPLSTVDVWSLRQTSYAKGIFPNGPQCPQDCVTGGKWEEWSECSVPCGHGTMTRELRAGSDTLSGRCPKVRESAHCYISHCNEPIREPNINSKTNSYMMVDKCQSVRPVESLLCSKICQVGYENKPNIWDVRPERFLCDGHRIKYKAVMIIKSCSCQQMDDDYLDSFLGLR